MHNQGVGVIHHGIVGIIGNQYIAVGSELHQNIGRETGTGT